MLQTTRATVESLAMLTLHEPGDFHNGFEVREGVIAEDESKRRLGDVLRVLRRRGDTRAAHHLSTIPFRLVAGTNLDCDEFSLLFATVPLLDYEHIRRFALESDGRAPFARIASTFGELGTYVKFVAVELASETPEEAAEAARALTPPEVKQVVHKWIGVSGGNLGDFSYATHQEFYVELDLPIDPNNYKGTTRERFSQILEGSKPAVQAKILEGVLKKFPVTSPASGSVAARTPELASEIRSWIARLRGPAPVAAPPLAATSAVVELALADAEELLRKNRPASCVDRVHTALHGYVRQVCKEQGLILEEDASLPALLRKLREEHPAFAACGPREEDVMGVLKALGSIADKLCPLRNKASAAHPNDDLLPRPEAMLVVNSVRTILHYLESKLSERKV